MARFGFTASAADGSTGLNLPDSPVAWQQQPGGAGLAPADLPPGRSRPAAVVPLLSECGEMIAEFVFTGDGQASVTVAQR